MATIETTLQQTTVDSLIPKGQKLIIIDSKDSIKNALKTLLTSNIYSAPLYDAEKKQYCGFIDLVDLVTFIISTVEKTISPAETSFDKLLHVDKLEFIHQTETANLKDLSAKNPMVTVKKGASLSEALKVFCATKARRVGIMENDILVNVLTQSAVISWISSNMKLVPFAKRNIGELKLGFKKVLSIPSSHKAIEAFKMMAEKRITAVAVLDEDNTLFTTLSAKDIKGIDLNSPFKKLFQELRKFIADIRSQEIRESIPIIWCYPHNTFAEVISKLAFLKIHRIFVVDTNKYPVGIISLGDVLKLVLDLKDFKEEYESSSDEEEKK